MRLEKNLSFLIYLIVNLYCWISDHLSVGFTHTGVLCMHCKENL